MFSDSTVDLLFITTAVLVGMLVVAWYLFRANSRNSSRDVYVEALELLAAGNPREAIDKFKEAIRENSDNIAAYLQLGDLLRERGLHSNAVRIHRDLTLREGLSEADQKRILSSLMLDYYASRQFDKGCEAARKVLKMQRKPEAATIHLLLEMLEKQHAWKEAAAILQKHSGFFQDTRSRLALYLVFQGLDEQQAGNIREARIRFKEALKKDSQCAAAYYYLGKSLFEENLLDEALDQWKKLCSRIPEQAHITFPELEKTCFELGRYNEAVSFYQDLIASGNNTLEPGLALAEIYNKKGEYDSAIEVLNMLDEYQDSPLLVGKKINLFFNKGQYKLAADQSRTFFLNGGSRNRRLYRCGNCGSEQETPQWNCNTCGNINSYTLVYHS